jgi:hypothetical protein
MQKQKARVEMEMEEYEVTQVMQTSTWRGSEMILGKKSKTWVSWIMAFVFQSFH